MTSARTPDSPRRPSGSAARRGSASSASRAKSGRQKVEPERPVQGDVAVLEPQDKERDIDLVAAPIVEPEVVEPEPEVVEPEPEPEPEVEPEPEPEVELEPEAEPEPEEPAAIVVERADADVDLDTAEFALQVTGLSKSFGSSLAVDGIDLVVPVGSFFGVVGPNGAGKTTTLSMITGLLRPDAGVVRVYGRDMWSNAKLAKRLIGVLPDRLRLFDRLTGEEFLFHAGALRGLDRATIALRSADLSAAFGLEHSLHRLVSDYSAGMTKKIAIAAAMIHAPRLLVLDEPFESVDPVSTSVVLGVLTRFTQAGGTVILSSHSMELTEQVCDGVAIIAEGRVLAEGPMQEVLGGRSLEQRFVELAGGEEAVEGMEWLQNFSD